MRELEGKVAVIAGGSQGIGAEIARVFSRAGARIVLLALDLVGLQLVADQIEQDGGQVLAMDMDVSVSRNWEKLTEVLIERGWGWDILVNGTYFRTLTPLGEVSDQDWDATIAVSLKAYFFGIRAAIPFMLRGGYGSVVNISSLQSRVPEKCFGAYAVAKGGVEALSRVVARDYAPVIRANTLVPGAIDTPGFTEGESGKIELGKRLPTGRIGFASEIAETALFLAGPRSSFITGTEVVADGGRSIT